MKAITAAQAMLHPTVVATINVLAETTQRLQDEIDELKAALAAEREKCDGWVKDGSPSTAACAAAIRARGET